MKYSLNYVSMGFTYTLRNKVVGKCAVYKVVSSADDEKESRILVQTYGDPDFINYSRAHKNVILENLKNGTWIPTFPVSLFDASFKVRDHATSEDLIISNTEYSSVFKKIVYRADIVGTENKYYLYETESIFKYLYNGTWTLIESNIAIIPKADCYEAY